MYRKYLLTLCALSTVTIAWSDRLPLGASLQGPGSFEHLELHFEVDYAELTAEVVLEVESEVGLTQVTLFNTLGQPVLLLDTAGSSELELAEISLESVAGPIEVVKATYPEGTYYIQATTVDSSTISGWVEFEHLVPGRFRVLSPQDGQVVSLEDVTLDWSTSAGAKRYLLEVEREAADFSLELVVPAWQTTFTIPSALLEAGVRYEYSLVAEGDNDNELEIEGNFYVVD